MIRAMATTPPARSASHHRLTRLVARGLRQRCGVGGKAHLLVAVSGGADSVAMLRALAALAPRRRWALKLSVGHVQHHLRELEAEADAEFVEALAREMELPCERVDLDATTAVGGNIEAWARRERYAALQRLAEHCGAEHVVTAHHADDQLETLLLRMVRGTGVRGLRGIAWRRRLGDRLMLVRPMLGADRADVLDFLNTIGQPWREDHTNADVTRDRARLRHEVIPVLRDVRGDAARKAVHLSEHARDVHRLVQSEIENQCERLIDASDDGWWLPRDEARRLPRAALTGLLGKLLHEAGIPGGRLTRRTVGAIVRAVRDRAGGERRFELTRSVRVVVLREIVRIYRRS